ncbi:transmembrane domain near C [Cryptosporidium sp. chipmunk genotype I]|uniref:transmembrane domain near C n=1 Tax=Cryptosporidium sp. chipmunk genotype I TaxID=1280935 RepID=UPI00351A1CC6|nr:transmembrane domain near C [Cryptosporidium sp. chipmunk genotype I]
MLNTGIEEDLIFPIIEVFIKKNCNQYSFNFTRINSIIRIFNGVTPDILLSLLKNSGKNVVEADSKIDTTSHTTDLQNVLSFKSKDIVTFKFRKIPEITLARYFFQFDKGHIVLCNCCYKDLYKLNTFDLVFYIQSQDIECSNRSHKSSKITLISGSSGNAFANKHMDSLSSILTDYGVIYIIYSFFLQLVHAFMAIKKYLRITLCEEKIEKLFVENFISNLDIQTCKKEKI